MLPLSLAAPIFQFERYHVELFRSVWNDVDLVDGQTQYWTREQ